MAETVAVIRPIGGLVDIPAEQLEAAKAQGYKPATPTEVKGHELEQEYGGIGHQATALAAGAASGLTIGASDYVASQVSEDARKALEAYRTVHPGTVMAGEVLGGVGGLALSGGTSAAARGLGAATRVGKVLGAPTRAVTKFAGLGRRAGQAVPGRGGQLIGAGLEAGIEGAIEVGGHYIGESAVANQELSAEKMAAALQTGALWGGGLGVGMKGLGMGLSGARSQLGKALAGRGGMGRAVSDKLAGVSAFMSGGDVNDLKKLGELSADGALQRRIATEAPATMDRLVDEIAADVNKIQKSAEFTNFGAGSQRKLEQIKRIVRTDNVGDQLIAARSVMRQADDALIELTAKHNSGKYWANKARGKNLRKRLQQTNKAISEAVAEGSDGLSAKIHHHVDAFKKEVQDLAKTANNAGRKNVMARADHQYLTKMDEDLFRPLLESTDVWGGAGAFQRRGNRNWTQGLDPGGGLRKGGRALTAEQGRSALNMYDSAYVADRKGIRSYLNALADPDADLEQHALHEFMKFYKQRGADGLDALKLSPKERVHWENVKRGAEGMEKRVAEAKETVTARDMLKRVQQDDGSGIATTVLGGIGGAALGGEGSEAMLGGAALGAFLKPGMAVRRLAAIEKLGRQLDGKVGAGLRKTFAKARPVTVKAAAPISRALTRAEERDNRIQVERRRMALDAIHAQPDALRAELSRTYASISGTAPNMAQMAADTTARAAAYLRAQLPPQTEKLGMLDVDMGMSDGEAVAWLRKADAVNEPWSLLDAMATGDLTTDQVEAVKAVYPQLYPDIQARAMADVMELQERGETLPYETLGQLTTLTGAPIVANHHPDMIAAAQAALASMPQPPKPPPAPRGGEPADFAEDMMTDRERLGRGGEA